MRNDSDFDDSTLERHGPASQEGPTGAGREDQADEAPAERPTGEESTGEDQLGNEPDPNADPDAGSTLEKSEENVLYVMPGSVRRRPKYGVFGALGGFIGLVVGLVLAQLGQIDATQNYTRVDLSIVLVGLGVPAGILLGLLIALFTDRRRK